MNAEWKENFFSQHGKFFNSSDNQKQTLPFKDHPQFPTLVDILSRKNQHHVLLCSELSPTIHILFFEALLQHLAHGHTPVFLRTAELMYLNLDNALVSDIKQLTIEKDFEALRDSLDRSDNYLFVTFMRPDLLSKDAKKADERFLRRQIDTLLAHPKCRFLLMIPAKDYPQYQHLEDQFTCLHLNGPTDTDVMTILKQQRIELEFFHHVLIPEELLTQALLLAERYLSTTHALEKTLLLLDSSAARAGIVDTEDPSHSCKPTLTSTILLSVLSDWTQIPASHLQITQFKHSEFILGLEQRVFGQETALTVLGYELLQAQAHLQHKPGPFSSFLFAGSAHSGKKTAALALVEQLFKQLNVLYFAQPSKGYLSLNDVKLQRCLDKQFFSLADVIRQTPYAVIMFEKIEQLPSALLDGLQEIVSTGYLHDLNGNQLNFRQSIIILSTTVGAASLAEFAESFIPDDDIYTMDLMQLVMSESKQDGHQKTHHYEPQEIIDKIIPDIADAFPVSLCQHLHVVPFLPLNKMAIEKIIRLKLKVLGKQLHARYGIELGYAPEVIRFLTQEVFMKRDSDNQIINPDKALKQLYFCVEQAILSQPDHKNHSNQLFLQLNETGHLLRCDWLAMTTLRQHTH